jgi:ABC-type nitrate/sulfonate/bicarbonate transport system ATPase subunit
MNASGVPAVVDIERLSLYAGRRILVQGLSIRLGAGRRIGITGPSGCGKTTLLRAVVSRSLKPLGSATRFAITPGRIGYIPQEGGLLPWYSLARNIGLRIPAAESAQHDRVALLLNSMELAGVRDDFPATLSGGELQRARLACAVAADPELYCADEPLTEVGLKQKWSVLERWSSEMGSRSASMLLVSHDLDTLTYLCDEVIVLRGAPGAPTGVFARIPVSGLHPRDPQDLSTGQLERTRSMMFDALFAK